MYLDVAVTREPVFGIAEIEMGIDRTFEEYQRDTKGTEDAHNIMFAFVLSVALERIPLVLFIR